MSDDVERNPDRRPAELDIITEECADHVICLIPLARREGVLVLRGGIDKDWHGVSLFTKDDIEFVGEIDARGEAAAAWLRKNDDALRV